MSAIDLTNLKANSSGNKTSPEATSYGTNDGKIHFGYLFPANINGTTASSMSGVHIQGFNSLHYITMIKNGPMQGATIQRSPGPHQIVCASNHAGNLNNKSGVGCFLLAENGDIIIRAENGRVRISGLDVDIRADGPDNTRGSINLDSNQKVNINTQSLAVTAPLGIKMFSTRNIDIISNTTINLISNFVKGLTASTLIKPPKNISSFAPFFKSTQNYF
jgi:hypothetical protein